MDLPLSLTIGVSTMGEDLEALRAQITALPESDRGKWIELLLIVQLPGEIEPPAGLDALEALEGVTVRCFNEKGLSRSRNRIFEFAKGDLIMLADTDCIHRVEVLRRVVELFQADKTIDFVSCKGITSDGVQIKNYRRKPVEHGIYSIFQVASWEIVVRRQTLIKKHLGFDERFGYGTTWGSGAENIFLVDLLKSGARGVYRPWVTTVTRESQISVIDPQVAYTKGAMCARMFGRWGGFVAILLISKKRLEGKTRGRLITLIAQTFRGYKDYRSQPGTR